jgi:hypothetical protein
MSEQVQWFEVVEYFDASEGKVLTHEGHRTYVRGPIGDIVVAQVSSKLGDGQGMVVALEMAKKAMAVAGIQDGLIVPDNVQFMKFQQVDEVTAADLETKRQESKN